MAVHPVTPVQRKTSRAIQHVYAWQADFVLLYRGFERYKFRFHLTRNRSVEGYVISCGMITGPSAFKYKIFVAHSLQVTPGSRRSRGLRFAEIIRVERLSPV